MSRRTWNKEEFVVAVATSTTILEVLTKLNLSINHGNYVTFHKYSRLWNVDVSHFVGSRKGLATQWGTESVLLEQVLVENSFYSKIRLKKRLIKEGLLPYRCAECGIHEWRDKSLVLQLEHRNGNTFDNRLENLCLLCPNCHSQTNTYAGRNRRTHFCPDCGKHIGSRPERCQHCANKVLAAAREKIHWPPTEELIRMVTDTSYVAVGKQLGVSDVAVRKRIRNHK
jgi:DNA-directed RNA polymerase subunit RPC12/RpoP